MYPIFSASARVSKATPISLLSKIAGPPLFPVLMAASIWIDRSFAQATE